MENKNIKNINFSKRVKCIYCFPFLSGPCGKNSSLSTFTKIIKHQKARLRLGVRCAHHGIIIKFGYSHYSSHLRFREREKKKKVIWSDSIKLHTIKRTEIRFNTVKGRKKNFGTKVSYKDLESPAICQTAL